MVTIMERLRARTGMRSGYTVLDKLTDARKKFVSMGAGGASKAFLSGQRPILTTLASIFPILGGLAGTGTSTASTLDTPPSAPFTGQSCIVGSSPTGAFVGHSGEVATWSGTAWHFNAVNTFRAGPGAANWGIYDYSGYDPMPAFGAETRRPRRRGI